MRRSSNTSVEPQVHAWRIEHVADGRYKAENKHYPDVFAFGDSEQSALTSAKQKMDLANRSGALAQPSPGAPLVPKA